MEPSGSSRSTGSSRESSKTKQVKRQICIKERSALRVTSSYTWSWYLTDNQGTPKREEQPIDIPTGPLQWSVMCKWLSSSSHDLQVDLVLKAGAGKATVAYKAVIYSHQVKYGEVEGVAVVMLGKSISLSLTNVVIPAEKRKNLTLGLFIDMFRVASLIKTPECSLADDIESAIKENEKFQDVTLLVGPETSREAVKANKLMLMARSPVFACMFQCDMVEASSNLVEISDISPDVLKKVLSFVYSGTIVGLSSLSMIQEVIVAADKYEIIRLKSLCENSILKYLDEENAAGLLVFANNYCSQELKDHVIDFVVCDSERCRRIMKTEGWKDVKEDGSDLIEEVFRCFIDTSGLPPTKIPRKSI